MANVSRMFLNNVQRFRIGFQAQFFKRGQEGQNKEGTFHYYQNPGCKRRIHEDARKRSVLSQ